MSEVLLSHSPSLNLTSPAISQRGSFSPSRNTEPGCPVSLLEPPPLGVSSAYVVFLSLSPIPRVQYPNLMCFSSQSALVDIFIALVVQESVLPVSS